MAADQNFTVHGFNQCAGDNQSQPGAAKLACGAGIRLGKGGKYFADLGVGHADTGILNFKLDAGAVIALINQRCTHTDVAAFGKFNSVVDQVGQYLLQT